MEKGVKWVSGEGVSGRGNSRAKAQRLLTDKSPCTCSGGTMCPKIWLGEVSRLDAQGSGACCIEGSLCPGDHRGHHRQGPSKASVPFTAAVTAAPSSPPIPRWPDAPPAQGSFAREQMLPRLTQVF